MKRLFILLLHLLTMSMAVYQRPDVKVRLVRRDADRPAQISLLRGIKAETGDIDTNDISRYCFEVTLKS